VQVVIGEERQAKRPTHSELLRIRTYSLLTEAEELFYKGPNESI
jgi:hypothetical protein